ncbi:MAG: hypothetical protein RBR68_07270 [Tenuifilaceae bacterium]|jgi:hypothetical protein|nr:hypothetical protein [Tenuifilaceae bacterium]
MIFNKLGEIGQFLTEIGVIVGEIADVYDNGYGIKKPLLIHKTQDGKSVNVQTVFFQEEYCFIYKDKIFLELKPMDKVIEIYEKYKVQIFSGLVVPDEKKLII